MNCSEWYRNKIKEGTKCCIQEIRNCNSCPYFGDCNQLQEDILRMIRREEIDTTDWSGFSGGILMDQDKNNCNLACAYAATDPWGELWCCLNKYNPKLPLLCPHYIERMIEFGE